MAVRRGIGLRLAMLAVLTVSVMALLPLRDASARPWDPNPPGLGSDVCEVYILDGDQRRQIWTCEPIPSSKYSPNSVFYYWASNDEPVRLAFPSVVERGGRRHTLRRVQGYGVSFSDEEEGCWGDSCEYRLTVTLGPEHDTWGEPKTRTVYASYISEPIPAPPPPTETPATPPAWDWSWVWDWF